MFNPGNLCKYILKLLQNKNHNERIDVKDWRKVSLVERFEDKGKKCHSNE